MAAVANSKREGAACLMSNGQGARATSAQLIRSLESFPLDRIGTREWVQQQQTLERLSALLHEEALSGGPETTQRLFCDEAKVGVLIEELISLDVWNENVKSHIKEAKDLSSLAMYLPAYQEGLIGSMLETLLFHSAAAAAADAQLPDLVEYCNRKIQRLLLRSHFNTEAAASSAAAAAAAAAGTRAQVALEAMAKHQEEQKDAAAFASEVCAVSLLRLICDHRKHLQMTVTTLLLNQYARQPAAATAAARVATVAAAARQHCPGHMYEEHSWAVMSQRIELLLLLVLVLLLLLLPLRWRPAERGDVRITKIAAQAAVAAAAAAAAAAGRHTVPAAVAVPHFVRCKVTRADATNSLHAHTATNCNSSSSSNSSSNSSSEADDISISVACRLQPHYGSRLQAEQQQQQQQQQQKQQQHEQQEGNEQQQQPNEFSAVAALQQIPPSWFLSVYNEKREATSSSEAARAAAVRQASHAAAAAAAASVLQHVCCCVQLRRHLNEAVYDQIPPLKDLHRYLEELSLGCAAFVPASSKTGLLVSVQPEFREKLMEQHRDNWKSLAAAARRHLSSNGRGEQEALRGVASLMASRLELIIARCRRCGLKATKRCSRCRNEAYCSKECQQADWRVHRHACKPAPDATSAAGGPATGVAAAAASGGDSSLLKKTHTQGDSR
ncbi:hypothetical protein Emag_001587 [Eimeria magna]